MMEEILFFGILESTSSSVHVPIFSLIRSFLNELLHFSHV